MSVTVEPRRPLTPPDPDSGVIRDAHTRRRRRHRRAAAAIVGLVALGAVIGWVVGHSGPTRGHRAAHGNAVALERFRRQRGPRGAYISPALEGGSYGWCVTMPDGGQTCTTVPMHNGSVVAIGNVVGTEPIRREERVIALLTPAVHGVLVNGHQTTTLTTQARLPYRLRLVQINFIRRIPRSEVPTPSGPPGTRISESQPQAPPPPTPMLVAIGASGRRLGTLGEGLQEASAIRWWEKPRPPAPGPCAA